MYFGPFPALLRIPLNFIYPAGHGKWSRISGFFAGVIALFAFGGLVRTALCSSPLSARARNWLGNACVVGFALGSPLLLLLGNLSIYDEAIIWGLALSLGALFFALRSQHTEGSAQTRMLLGFSLCAGGALLSRVTFGAPFI
jgi:CBS-domain-containing membrane protein